MLDSMSTNVAVKAKVIFLFKEVYSKRDFPLAEQTDKGLHINHQSVSLVFCARLRSTWIRASTLMWGRFPHNHL